MTPAERFRPGVTVVFTDRARRIGALLREGDLNRAALLEVIDPNPAAYPDTPYANGRY